MASITFSGGTVQNVWVSTPAARLNQTAPKVRVVGQRRALLATGAPRTWAYRTDYRLTFTIRDISDADQEVCLALSLALQNDEEVTVVTGDASGRTYARCVLAPDADPPDLSPPDPQTMRREMSFDLLNLDGDPFFAAY